MGVIYICFNTWAFGWEYIQQLFTRNRDALQNKKIICSAESFEVHSMAENHQKLLCNMIYKREKGIEFDQSIIQATNKWRENLKAGNNVILFYRPRRILTDFLALHSFFKSQLKDFLPKYFIGLGRMDYAFEELRRVYPYFDDERLLASLKEYVSYPAFIKKAKELAGPDNVRVTLAQLQPDLATQDMFVEVAENFFDFVGLSSTGLELPVHVPRWRSSVVMQVAASINNLWQRPDDQLIAEELANFDFQGQSLPAIYSQRSLLKQLAGRQKKIWSAACEAADISSPWQEAKWPESASVSDAFKGIENYAPNTLRFIEDNIFLVPDQWQASANQILAGGGVERREIPEMSVLTMTYNQERYIGQCIESVASQERSFGLEHIIVDDGSSDRTSEIIAGYANKYPHVRPVFLGRRRGHENIKALFNACRSKYAALCDGDDYFTDNRKLQKQYDFLEKNPDCAICAHKVAVHFDDAEHQDFVYPPPEAMPKLVDNKCGIDDLIRNNFIQTNSAVYRWRFTKGVPDWFRYDLCPSDWYWHLLHAETGRIAFLPEVMSVYRRHKKAYYVNAFIAPVEHRRTHGMRELETYDAFNKHFNGRYFFVFADLADGVLTNFLQMQIDGEDSKLLNEAADKYPFFVSHFLESLKK